MFVLLSRSEYLSSSTDLSDVCVDYSLVFCVVFCGSLLMFFVLYFLSITSYVSLLLTASDYPFGIFQLFLYYTGGICYNFNMFSVLLLAYDFLVDHRYVIFMLCGSLLSR